MNGEKNPVTPLERLLSDVSLEDLVIFMARMKLHWTLSCGKTGHHYRAVIMKDGMEKYKASSPNGASRVMRMVIAKFLVGEKRDIHDI